VNYHRVELCLQQNEIIDIFPDDYMQLAEDDGIVADKSDTNLKVCSLRHSYLILYLCHLPM
jgi:hypothetical protein